MLVLILLILSYSPKDQKCFISCHCILAELFQGLCPAEQNGLLTHFFRNEVNSWIFLLFFGEIHILAWAERIGGVILPHLPCFSATRSGFTGELKHFYPTLTKAERPSNKQTMCQCSWNRSAYPDPKEAPQKPGERQRGTSGSTGVTSLPTHVLGYQHRLVHKFITNPLSVMLYFFSYYQRRIINEAINESNVF